MTITRNVLEDNGVADYSHFGGGLRLSGTNHLVADNVMRNNVGGRGAGAALCCDDITFERNRVEGNVGYSDHGGGINQVGTGVLRYNVIRGTRIGEGLGYGWGGGILVLGTPRLSYTVYTENHAPSVGGAVFIDDGARAILEHELISNNTAATGAAVYLDRYGEDVFSTAELRHCTIAGNSASETPLGNAVSITGGSSATVTNSIAWDNQGDDFEVDERSSISVTFTLNEEGAPGIGNLSARPAVRLGERSPPPVHRRSLRPVGERRRRRLRRRRPAQSGDRCRRSRRALRRRDAAQRRGSTSALTATPARRAGAVGRCRPPPRPRARRPRRQPARRQTTRLSAAGSACPQTMSAVGTGSSSCPA